MRAESLLKFRLDLQSQYEKGEISYPTLIELYQAEQRKDFAELSTVADQNCPHCFGRAYTSWNTLLEIYSPCRCLIKNVAKLELESRKN